jgi:hypothetical protein
MKMKQNRAKQPSRAEIKEHMMKFNELLKAKQEEFKQNHVAQIRQLRKHTKMYPSHDDDHSVTSGAGHSEHDGSLSPKKPAKSKHVNNAQDPIGSPSKHHMHRQVKASQEQNSHNRSNNHDEEHQSANKEDRKDTSRKDDVEIISINKFVSSNEEGYNPSERDSPTKKEMVSVSSFIMEDGSKLEKQLSTERLLSELPLTGMIAYMPPDWMKMMQSDIDTSIPIE